LKCREARELAEIRALEEKHDEEAEELRLKWLAELRKWDEDVAFLRAHLLSNHNMPDASWLAGYIYIDIYRYI